MKKIRAYPISHSRQASRTMTMIRNLNVFSFTIQLVITEENKKDIVFWMN